MSAENPIIVFIDGPAPTEKDRELFDSVGADQFLNAQLVASVIPHSYVVAVDPALIPEGYNTKAPKAVKATPAPAKSPTAPTAPVATGALGVQSEGNPFTPAGK